MWTISRKEIDDLIFYLGTASANNTNKGLLRNGLLEMQSMLLKKISDYPIGDVVGVKGDSEREYVLIRTYYPSRDEEQFGEPCSCDEAFEELIKFRHAKRRSPDLSHVGLSMRLVGLDEHEGAIVRDSQPLEED